MKTGKEIKSKNFNKYNVTFGSVNNKNPKAIYINISSWANPKSEDEINYNLVIRNLNKNIKQNMFNNLSEETDKLFDKDRTIVDLDIRESGIRYGKRSFMSCEITLFLNEEYSITTTYMKDKLEYLTEKLINDIFENNKVFDFHMKKK